MNIARSLSVIRSLVDGINPHTGKEISPKSLCQQPDTILALRAAIRALECVQNLAKKKYLYSGYPWDEAEDQRLVEAYESDKPIVQIAEQHLRTVGAIRSRLRKLGFILRTCPLARNGADCRGEQRRFVLEPKQ